MRATEGVKVTTTQPTTIAELLKKRRGTDYKSEAARTIGVSRQIYDAWETGHFIPGDEWATRLAAYLEHDLAAIVLHLYNDRIDKLDDPTLHNVNWRPDNMGEWFRRPIDVDAEITRLATGIGHPGWKAA